MRSLMIARPIRAVITPGASGEPEPRHDRPAEAPPAPARPRQVRAGWFERGETDNRLVAVADPEPAPDLPPLPKRDPGKTLKDAVDEVFAALGTDSDPDMDEALRRVRTGGGK
ncbi:hypothetical protein [Streptomyces sp. NPDC058665]|uniref:hypothetical protein n=1 Tax=Streptomyces sp. NPDC058665 TaxID=3346586 RepID=UPI003646FF66